MLSCRKRTAASITLKSLLVSRMPPTTTADDTWLFGWDPTPGIVSVWADRSGRALVWQRDGARLTCTEEQFRPWLFAATLEDLGHVGAALMAETAPGAERAPFWY